jgi:class 3 adenylate cyclase
MLALVRGTEAMAETRKIAAILVADVVGYSRLAGADEARTLSRLRGLRSDPIDPAIAAHHGRVVKSTGDGALVEFRSVVGAVRCAIEVQNGMIERNSGLPQDRRIEFRIGIHLGDVVEEADGNLMAEALDPDASSAEPTDRNGKLLRRSFGRSSIFDLLGSAGVLVGSFDARRRRYAS